MAGGAGDPEVSESELVGAVLRDLEEAADRWEAVIAAAATITYSVDMGDIRAVANCDGKLVDLSLHPSVMATYNHHELADRLNLALAALRAEALDDYRARYGGTLE
jgi:DNA-binding protein YbaB